MTDFIWLISGCFVLEFCPDIFNCQNVGSFVLLLLTPNGMRKFEKKDYYRKVRALYC